MGGGFPVEHKGKGEGGGEGGGWGRDLGKSMRKLCRNYPLTNHPLVSPLEIPSVPKLLHYSALFLDN